MWRAGLPAAAAARSAAASAVSCSDAAPSVALIWVAARHCASALSSCACMHSPLYAANTARDSCSHAGASSRLRNTRHCACMGTSIQVPSVILTSIPSGCLHPPWPSHTMWVTTPCIVCVSFASCMMRVSPMSTSKQDRSGTRGVGDLPRFCFVTMQLHPTIPCGPLHNINACSWHRGSFLTHPARVVVAMASQPLTAHCPGIVSLYALRMSVSGSSLLPARIVLFFTGLIPFGCGAIRCLNWCPRCAGAVFTTLVRILGPVYVCRRAAELDARGNSFWSAVRACASVRPAASISSLRLCLITALWRCWGISSIGFLCRSRFCARGFACHTRSRTSAFAAVMPCACSHSWTA